MNNLAYGLDRPDNSRIEILDGEDTVTVHIPRPRMPIGIYAVILLTAAVISSVFVSGLVVLVLRQSAPIYTRLIGSPTGDIPLAWRLFGITGCLAACVIGVISLYFAVRPLTRSEWIRFDATGILLLESIFLRRVSRCFVYRDVGEFRNRRDPAGLMESELVMLLNRPMLAGGADELQIAQSTTESEKQWLASVLSDILSRYEGDS
jgi:hypothetical protein